MRKRFILATLASFLMAAQTMILPHSISAEEAEKDTSWKREIGIGYNQANGNTNNSQFNLNGVFAREMDIWDFLFVKADIFYSSKDDRMDGQKWSTESKAAYKFGDDKMWFASAGIDLNHDKFADIYYRLMPQAGVGKWISRTDDWKWMLEGSLGYQISRYYDDPDDEAAVFIAHTYLKKMIFTASHISEDLKLIPTLEGGKGYRVRSETEFINPIYKGLDLSLRYVLDYNSQPATGKKKTDTLFTAGLKYSF